ncbi:MAG: hypothetical protein JXR48_14200 [Candidatus Delongbacteria bacterium]|nr:hypothetical protein [Candidatus Delongbacteria bacterium]MBN2836107.1 hypothetical protein [Candidatus Delongbacteria bacterium]
MDLADILSEKSIKPKEKTEIISNMIVSGGLSFNELITYAKKSKDSVKATCIEAIEFSSKTNPEIVNEEGFDFVTESLASNAPRVKWEAAKVIGNCVSQFQGSLDMVIDSLLTNSKDSGTVVRWSVAYALGEIVKLKTDYNNDLIPKIIKIHDEEVKNSIKKIYANALKKAGIKV